MSNCFSTVSTFNSNNESDKTILLAISWVNSVEVSISDLIVCEEMNVSIQSTKIYCLLRQFRHVRAWFLFCCCWADLIEFAGAETRLC